MTVTDTYGEPWRNAKALSIVKKFSENFEKRLDKPRKAWYNIIKERQNGVKIMSMNAEQIIELMKSELKRAEEFLERLKDQKEHHDLVLQTEGEYIILKQLLGVIESE